MHTIGICTSSFVMRLALLDHISSAGRVTGKNRKRQYFKLFARSKPCWLDLGALAVLKHAVNTNHNRIFIYGDSKLIISQLNGVWKCKAEHLAPYYEEGLHITRQLQILCDTGVFKLAHVYREYNVDADGLANAQQLC